MGSREASGKYTFIHTLHRTTLRGQTRRIVSQVQSSNTTNPATTPEPRLIELGKTDQLAVFGYRLRRELNPRLSWQGQPRSWRAGENARVCPLRHQLSSIRFVGRLDFSSPSGGHNDQAEPGLWCFSVIEFYHTLHR